MHSILRTIPAVASIPRFARVRQGKVSIDCAKDIIKIRKYAFIGHARYYRKAELLIFFCTIESLKVPIKEADRGAVAPARA
ncbi:MAG: hypothetical protein CMM78_06595 [Rhodospirillaceae bacterium]|nr:hypothetical protein [Rhodospirillales bacterium]MAX47861.1 hypothetical protein [Rhodospirillaceae bacterium]